MAKRTRRLPEKRFYECEICTELFSRWSVNRIRRPRVCDDCREDLDGRARPVFRDELDPDVVRETIYLGLRGFFDVAPLDEDWEQI